MPRNDPYKEYRYESENFLLRQVRREDAPDLLRCYSDPAAVALMNDDNCGMGFLCGTVDDMLVHIGYWNEEYSTRMYIRPAIVDKHSGQVLGTMEVFSGSPGVLRLDLRSDQERPEVLKELLSLAVREFPRDFELEGLVIKAVPQAAVRRDVLAGLGFRGPDGFRDYEDYYRLDFAKFRRELGIAYCGLACCLCSENGDCRGCKQNGCAAYAECQNYGCVTERDIDGCWECPDFPCGRGMLGNPRMRAFAKFAKEHGTEGLMDCLERNCNAGIVYHYPGGLTGDYDLPTEQEILDLLERGGR